MCLIIDIVYILFISAAATKYCDMSLVVKVISVFSVMLVWPVNETYTHNINTRFFEDFYLPYKSYNLFVALLIMYNKC